MSWSFNYLHEMQKEIQKYKNKMAFMISLGNDIANQPELIKTSQELDKILTKYQLFRKNLTSYQNLPYSVTFYMNKVFKRAVKINNNISVTKEDKNNLTYIVENEDGKIIGITHDLQKIHSMAFCSSGSSLWSANKIFDEKQCDYLVIVNTAEQVEGILERNFVKSLCQEKTLSHKTVDRFYHAEEAFNNIPVSIFVLDKDFYIEYANNTAIKNFKEILPSNYIFKKADLVFSGFLNNHYEEFINSDFWQHIKSGKECFDIEIKLLNYISLLASIKIIRKNFEIENIVISFVNIDELKQKVDEISFSADELSQALSLFIPYNIEKKIRGIPEYKDLYDPDTKMITIFSKINDGGYWHVINCLRILSQIDRLGVLEKINVHRDSLLQAIMVHDIGKLQPKLNVGQVVDPAKVFEKSKLHAFRSARFCKEMNYDTDVINLVKYHHHEESELPKRFPKKLLPALKLLKLIDGLSAAITRRNAVISFEVRENLLVINEDNERLDYKKEHIIYFTNTNKKSNPS